MEETTKHKWNSSEPGIKELSKQSVINKRIKDWGGRHEVKVVVRPDLSKDRVFMISVGGKEAYLDIDQLTWYTRLI